MFETNAGWDAVVHFTHRTNPGPGGTITLEGVATDDLSAGDFRCSNPRTMEQDMGMTCPCIAS